ncbi:hypothetical protein [Streptomyces griseorubiginosus]|uniref:hypothetical protein n=1 Tax=Streptomyces griseorubiginosus TaxID=67304 RepID=UPI0036E5062E
MEHFIPGAHPNNHAREVSRLATCRRCGDNRLAWKQSARTGGWYLCDVQAVDRWCTAQNPQLRYFPLARLPHRCPKSAATVT